MPGVAVDRESPSVLEMQAIDIFETDSRVLFPSMALAWPSIAEPVLNTQNLTRADVEGLLQEHQAFDPSAAQGAVTRLLASHELLYGLWGSVKGSVAARWPGLGPWALGMPTVTISELAVAVTRIGGSEPRESRVQIIDLLEELHFVELLSISRRWMS